MRPFVLFIILLSFSAFSAKLLMLLQTERYQNPALHEGVWVGPVVLGSGDQMRVQWECRAGYRICTGTNHGAMRCTIGPGMAHVDECMCGKTRSGVYGSWY